MEQRFELDLRMTDKGVVCNAQNLLEMLPSKLKPYQYIVTKENVKKAKEERTKLNNLVVLFKQERDRFEESEIAQWNEAKALLMKIEKTIKLVADDLGDQVKALDKADADEKKAKVKALYEQLIVELEIDKRVQFELLYDDKAYSKKKMTETAVLEDIKKKIEKIKSDIEIVDTLLADNKGNLVLLKEFYYEDYDLENAKRKLDDFKRLESLKESHEQKVAETVKVTQNGSNEVVKEITFESMNDIHIMTATMEAPREFFDEMNVLVKKYKAKVKVTSRVKKGE